jgi:hypothetical protein
VIDEDEMDCQMFDHFLRSVQNERLKIEEIQQIFYDLKVKGDIYGLFFGELPEKYRSLAVRQTKPKSQQDLGFQFTRAESHDLTVE